MKIVLLISLLVFHADRLNRKTEGWVSLFNGRDLSGWETFLGPHFDTLGHQIPGSSIGLNKDPDHVFSIVEEKGEKMIRISGEDFGAIATLKEYANYHLQFKFKWGSLTWGPKKGRKKDSGLLYHSVGAWGADFGYWMRSQEFQIEETNCGDYWGVAGGLEDIRAIKESDSVFVYSPKGEWYRFQANTKTGRRCIKAENAENPSGEWNTVDLYTHQDTSIHVINGRRMMVLYHSAQSEGGQIIPMIKGRIQIQSEGAEIFLKEIRIQSLVSIPVDLLE